MSRERRDTGEPLNMLLGAGQGDNTLHRWTPLGPPGLPEKE